MMRLMVEQMRACHVRCFNVVPALIVRIGERPAPKVRVQVTEESFNPCVFLRSCAPQPGKIIVKNSIEGWSRSFAVLKQAQPSAVTQQNVIQQPINAAKRSCTFSPVFSVIQLRALRKKPLVRNAVVPGQHLEVCCQIHSHELTSDQNRLCYGEGSELITDAPIPANP